MPITIKVKNMYQEDLSYGLFLSDRQLDFLSNYPQGFDRMKCFATFLQMAVKETTHYEKKEYSVDLTPGQFAISEVELAKLWKCNRKTASKMVDMFHEVGLVSSVPNCRTTVFTVHCVASWYIDNQAIRNTHEAREYILKNVMEPCIAAPRASVSKWAPKIVQIKIDPDKIGDVVGQKGKNINAIIAAYDVTIDIEDDGSVSICGQDMDKMDQAIETIRIITTEFEKGMILTGKVVSIKEFGAFLEFAPGKEAMVHISKIANTRINKVEDVLQIGDVVRAICLGKDKMGRISFSIKDCPKDPMDVGRVVASADPE